MAVQLVLVFHNHQPVGNFGHVFEMAYERCYRPLLDALARHERVKVALHHTGPLLEWLSDHRPRYLDDVRALVARGQVEVVGGAFYEPMLSVLPDRDARGQLAMMQDWCEKRLGQRPRGMWLAERVWEPDLPRVIASAGLRWTLLDDSHFFAAGLPEGQLAGYYVTDKAGDTLAIFPIDKTLRYLIPFQPVHAFLEAMRDAGRRGVSALTYGDDGEKFGVWPGTHDWVFEKGWLESFLRGLEDNPNVVETVHPTELCARQPPTGRVYLPTASYHEMGEWSLPAEAVHRYEALEHALAARGELERARAFVRGGIWQNFFAKYPEANAIHKRMLAVSERVAEASRAHPVPEATTELYRGQCNCAYWHGLFGGLYLNYLRAALYRALIRAEALADEALGATGVRLVRGDFDSDLREELALVSHDLAAWIDPDEGGSVWELDHRPRAINLCDVLARREEGYHQKLRDLAARPHGDRQGAPASIHDLVRSKEPGLEKHLVFDAYRRASFLDRVHHPAHTLDAHRAGDDGDIADLRGGAYRVLDADASGVTLERTGSVRRDGGAQPIAVTKRYALDPGALRVSYSVANPGAEALEATFAVELNLTLLAGDAPDRFYAVPGEARARLNTRGVSRGLTRFELRDGWTQLALELSADRAFELWRYPVETVSQSEDGFERTWQGTCALLRFPLAIPPGGRADFAVKLGAVLRPLGPEERA